MEDEPCNSTKADQRTAVTEQYNDQFWTKILKGMPNFTHEDIEKHLILKRDKTPYKKPADALQHKKGRYQLFKGLLDRPQFSEDEEFAMKNSQTHNSFWEGNSKGY